MKRFREGSFRRNSVNDSPIEKTGSDEEHQQEDVEETSAYYSAYSEAVADDTFEKQQQGNSTAMAQHHSSEEFGTLEESSALPTTAFASLRADTLHSSAGGRGSLQSSLTNTVTTPITPRTSSRDLDPSEFTISKLRFSSVGFYGREQETSVLRECWENVCQGSCPRQLVFISGFSGVGKSELANTIRRDTETNRRGIFAKGKFDLNLRQGKPYSAVIAACAEICGAILALQQYDVPKFELIRNSIQTEMGTELSLLIRFIPVVLEVVDVDPDEANDDNDPYEKGTSSITETKNKFQFAFVRFIRIICRNFFPLVLVLDDLQWSDHASLELLEVAMTDRYNANLMIVGIYRSNEIDETHIFNRTKDNLQVKSDAGDLSLTAIEIGNLDLDSVHRIIEDLLSTDYDPRTRDLAKLCFRKSGGNVFFLRHFLQLLFETKLLTYNLGTLSWNWEVDKIELETNSTDNVVSILKDKMSALEPRGIEILKLASCLGSSFELKLLYTAWRQMSREESDSIVLEKYIERLMEEGFVSRSCHNNKIIFRWIHDKIQSAATKLIPDEEQPVFNKKVADIFLSELTESEMEENIFVVVHMLNKSRETIEMDEERIRLAELNRCASQRSLALSAFECAADYARIGIALLPPKAWQEHYDSTLQLHSIGAKAEGIIGNTHQMETYCRAVLSQKDRPLEDMFDIYGTWADGMLSQGNFVDAKALLLDILNKFNCRFPQNQLFVMLGILKDSMRVKSSAKSLSIQHLDPISEGNINGILKLLDRLGLAFHRTQDIRMVSVVFRTLEWTMKYGYCDFSPRAFATTGVMLLGVFGDTNAALKYANLAMELQDRANARATASRTSLTVNAFILPWAKPMSSLLKPLLDAYEDGLKTGDTESSGWAIYHWILLKFMIGNHLKALEADFNLYTRQMHDLNLDEVALMSSVLRQVFLNLLGRNNVEDHTRLLGEALSEDEHLVCENVQFQLTALQLWESSLFTYFGEHRRAADMAIKLGPGAPAKVLVASPSLMLDSYLKGISCFAAAGQTKKKKYCKAALTFQSKVKKWLVAGSSGNPNVAHYCKFLEAEAAAFKRKNEAPKLYEETIVEAAKGGFQQDAALASERLAEYHLSMDNRDEANYRFKESIRYYSAWGAMGKVEHIFRKHSGVLFEPDEIFATKEPSAMFDLDQQSEMFTTKTQPSRSAE